MAMLNVPLIPWSDVVFPHKPIDLNLSDRDLVSLLDVVYRKGNRYAGVFLKKEDSGQHEFVSSVSDVYGVGMLVDILKFQDQNEKCRLHVKGFQRISLKGIFPWSSDGCPQSEPQPANPDADIHVVYTHKYSQREESMASTSKAIPMEQTPIRVEKFMMAQIKILDDEPDAKPEELEALYQDIKKFIDSALILVLEVTGGQLYESDHGIRAYELASLYLTDPHKKQLVLEEEKIGRRLRLLSLLLMKQKLLPLLDEYKIIHDKCVDIQNNEEYPKAVRDAINKGMITRKMKYEEYNKCKNHLEMLTSFPWNVPSQDNFDVEHAKRSLDADLIGLEDVKRRILDFIQGGQERTLFIHGPSGAGKKSIGKAIANALNRKWAMVDMKRIMDMKGMIDEADLSGKMWMLDDCRPGKIVESLKATGTMNPVILLNVMDIPWSQKLQHYSALMYLHWATKFNFHDNYLGFKVDLSKF